MLGFFLGVAIVQELTPIHDRTASSVRGLGRNRAIAMMLAGAYPLVKVLTKVLSKPLGKLGSMIRNQRRSSCRTDCMLCKLYPGIWYAEDMDNKGKIINIAFACCAAFAWRSLRDSVQV